MNNAYNCFHHVLTVKITTLGDMQLSLIRSLARSNETYLFIRNSRLRADGTQRAFVYLRLYAILLCIQN